MKYDELSNSENSEKLRDYMKTAINAGIANEVTIEDIIHLKRSTMIRHMQEAIIPLRSARNRAETVIRQNIDNLYTYIDPNDDTAKKKFKDIINTLNENELWSIIQNRWSIIDFLHNYFGIAREAIKFKMIDFQPIIDKIEDDDDLKRTFVQSATQYKKFGTPISIFNLGRLFSHFEGDLAIRQELCDLFDMRFTLDEAKSLGLIDDATIEKKIKAYISEPIWKKLSDEDKKILTHRLMSDRGLMFRYSDFGSAIWTSEASDFVSKKIHTYMQRSKPDGGSVEGIMQYLEIDGSWRVHSSFLQSIQKNPATKLNVRDIEKLKQWSVLVVPSEKWFPLYVKIMETDVMQDEANLGITRAVLNGSAPWTVGWPKYEDFITYDDLYQELSRMPVWTRVFSEPEFAEFFAQSDDELTHTSPLDDENAKIKNVEESESNKDFAWLKAEIDKIDPERCDIVFKEGMTFVSTTWDGESGTWTIDSIDEGSNTLKIASSSIIEGPISFSDFLEGAKDQWFERIANIEDDNDLLRILEKYGVKSGTTINKNHDLAIESQVTNNKGKVETKEQVYKYFQSQSGGHIFVGGFKDGMVDLAEFSWTTSLADLQKKWNDGTLKDEDIDGNYTFRKVTYGAFVKYLKDNDMYATTDDLLVPRATAWYDPKDPKFNRDIVSAWTKNFGSVADMILAGKWLFQAVEHYFEKYSRLNASRISLRAWRMMGLPEDVLIQLQADEVASIKEIIQKYEDNFRWLNGPKARMRALKTVQNKHAQPEEVAAAILFMLKGYGQLYAEDNMHAQWSEAFINGLINACGITWSGLVEAKQKARDKARAMIGNEWENPREPTEEEMIWAFCKSMDGNFDKYPMAATLIKSLWWPSGYEAAWRKDGMTGAKEKWIRQAGDLVNARARSDHGLSALITHEYHTAIGSMESTAAKTPAPAYQVIPIVWALGWYTQYISTKANQEIKWYADAKGHSMHVFSFLRTKEENDIYRDTFLKAFDEIATNDEKTKIRSWINDIQLNDKNSLRYDDRKGMEKLGDKRKNAINGLADLWRKYCDQWLHDTLQGKNGWISEHAQTDPAVKKYAKQLSDIHHTNEGDAPPPSDNDWYIQQGYAFSPIVNYHEVDGKMLNSTDRMLKKIQIDPHSMAFRDTNHISRYWNPVVNMFGELRTTQMDPAVKKAQYMQYRKNVLTYFNDRLSARWSWEDKGGLEALRQQTYFRDFNAMGIDPKVIFEYGDPIYRIERNAEEDYNRWLSNMNLAENTHGISESVNNIMTKVLRPGSDGTGPAARGGPQDPSEAGSDVRLDGAPVDWS